MGTPSPADYWDGGERRQLPQLGHVAEPRRKTILLLSTRATTPLIATLVEKNVFICVVFYFFGNVV